MRWPLPGKSPTAASFRERLAAIDPAFRCDLDLAGEDGPLAQSREVLGRRVGNRWAIHPMEGWDGTAEGLPSEHTLRRWQRFGASGAKLIWGGEAFAVCAAGRANPSQLFLNPAVDSAGGIARLRDHLLAAHREAMGDVDDLVVGLQLTHSGRWARPDGPPAPRTVFRHPLLDARVDAGDDAILTDGELEAIGERFVAAAQLAASLGFHFVDVKCCHGYLLHETLAARSRPGPYGGSFENRTRLLRRIIEDIRTHCPRLGIGVRVSIADVQPFTRGPGGGGIPEPRADSSPYDHGFGVDPTDPCRFDLEEPLRFLELLRGLDVGLVNISLGSPYYCPHILRPAAYPPSDGYHPPVDPLENVWDHLRSVRAVKAAFPDLVVVGSGYSYLQEYLPHVAQHEVREGHVDLVGLGRMVLAYPELPRDVLAGRPLQRKLLCRTFSDCTTAPRNGMISGCYPLDPHYKTLPENERMAALRKRARDDQA